MIRIVVIDRPDRRLELYGLLHNTHHRKRHLHDLNRLSNRIFFLKQTLSRRLVQDQYLAEIIIIAVYEIPSRLYDVARCLKIARINAADRYF